ncbi:MAG: TraB/GumN family protein [Parasphingorhabdus sp.]|uniref:TraB/GumN family protein n=1 Tax=Parasphingorhabdus sp. TaxID=2709688 RepID=UPI003297FECE
MMRRWSSALLFLPLTLGLASCQPEPLQSAGDIAPQPNEIATIPDDPDPALWVLKDEDTTIYLFGTVHILKPGLTWFDEAVKDAFDASDELVIEMIEPDPAEMMKIVNDLAIDKTGVSLRDKLKPEDRTKYEAAMTSLNIPVNAFDPLDPWFASVSMSLVPLMQGGYDTNSGVEDALNSHAKARNMKIVGLETPRQQLGFFDNLPEDVQIRFLNFNVDSIGEMADGMENMVAHWANANISALAELMNAGLEEKILYETLLSNRNANWAVWVDERMKQPGTVFLAVGAGHLAGDDSLQEMLKKRDLIVKRIKY